MTAHHAKPRRGRWLDPVGAYDVIGRDQGLTLVHAVLIGQGYVLKSRTVRPYLAADGLASVRLVWRKRRPFGQSCHTVSYRFPASAVLG